MSTLKKHDPIHKCVFCGKDKNEVRAIVAIPNLKKKGVCEKCAMVIISTLIDSGIVTAETVIEDIQNFS